MRKELPAKVHKYETGILNLDSGGGDGTHWVAFSKHDNKCLYYDSFGNLKPPKELVIYLNSAGPCLIRYNYQQQQKFTAVNCGHLVLKFLYETAHRLPF